MRYRRPMVQDVEDLKNKIVNRLNSYVLKNGGYKKEVDMYNEYVIHTYDLTTSKFKLSELKKMGINYFINQNNEKVTFNELNLCELAEICDYFLLK